MAVLRKSPCVTKCFSSSSRLATLSPARLKERWGEIEPSASPGLSPALLRRLLAQRLQERQLGSLPAAIVRELERTGRGAPSSSPRQMIPLTPGARLAVAGQSRRAAGEVFAAGSQYAGDRIVISAEFEWQPASAARFR